jgi:hypothetical protein
MGFEHTRPVLGSHGAPGRWHRVATEHGRTPRCYRPLIRAQIPRAFQNQLRSMF